MFTGIIQGQAHVTAVDQRPGLSTIVLEFPADRVQGVEIGASISINGTCLTVTRQQGNQLYFDAMQETLRLTTLGDLKTNDSVNFERAARVGDEIGGHLLSGHVHTTATVERIEPSENNLTLVFRVPQAWMKYIFAKGYIAIEGASLTIGTVTEDTFNVHLIPETLRVTTFTQLAEGDRVNIEIDSQTQTIVDTLARMGFDNPPRQ
ncbi:riboflavin synthase subunit alpha [Marinobacter fonticola]|uniref:riboflavin synthase subunit alpha n=1 Tax=Marinobacter fonticola TaxID=2603215 RepID=UPI0011E75E8A|nr:riboflavin synthase subunit alpha [Marinobacter fonticola]